MGGDPDAARRYFDEAIKIRDGKYLMTKVMMARFLGVVTQDRSLFDSTLNSVVDAPATIDPDNRLANELAKRRAARGTEFPWCHRLPARILDPHSSGGNPCHTMFRAARFFRWRQPARLRPGCRHRSRLPPGFRSGLTARGRAVIFLRSPRQELVRNGRR